MGSFQLADSCRQEWGSDALYQWSKGEFADAKNFADDLALMNEHFRYREDDIVDAVALVRHGDRIDPRNNRGQIAKNTDTDSFLFEITASKTKVSLRIDRSEIVGGAMLDVDATIFDAQDEAVAHSNPLAARHAEFEITLDRGSYRLEIRGGAEGTPEFGFSNYSSLGFYAIGGEIVEAGDSDSDTTSSDSTSIDSSGETPGTTQSTTGNSESTDATGDENETEVTAVASDNDDNDNDTAQGSEAGCSSSPRDGAAVRSTALLGLLIGGLAAGRRIKL